MFYITENFFSKPTIEQRNWADLHEDCLVNIFTRLETVDLVESVQFVCKSWFHATLDPLCWKTLIFPDDVSFNFVQFVVHRSQRISTKIVIQGSLNEHGLIYLSNQCPELTTLFLSHGVLFKCGSLVSKIIGKWKKLMILRKDDSFYYPTDLRLYGFKNFKEMLESISVYCLNFRVLDWSRTDIGDEDVSAIVTFLPNIKELILSISTCGREHVVTLLEECRDLVHLDLSYCLGFEVDDEILMLSSHIRFFDCTGSKFYTPLSRNKRALDLTVLFQ